MPAWILSRPSGIPDPIQVGAFGVSGAPVFGSTIAANFTRSSTLVVTATSNATFTFSSPTGLVNGQTVTFMVRNTSGGALSGTSPFTNTVFKLATWTQPATGSSRSISFLYDGTHLVEISRTPTDVPN